MLKKLKNVNLFLVIMITAFVFGISLKIVFADYFLQSYGNGIKIGYEALSLSNGQNLLWGLIKSDSTGSFILLQDSAYNDKFKIGYNGNLLSSGNIEALGNMKAGGQNVCLQNGTNCPAAGIPSDLVAGSSVVSDAEVDNNITLTNITQITNRSHSNLSGLDNDDHAQYLRADGGRAMSGALTANGGIDLQNSGDTDYKIEGRRSIGEYPGWDANRLYINGYNDWSSGVTVAGAGLNVDAGLNVAGVIKQGGAAVSLSGHAHSAGDITSGTLLTGRGGTGLSATGASGNLLRSNGSTWESWAPNYLTSEVDGSVTNEIQTLGTSGNTITLSLGGGSVTAPYASNTDTVDGQHYNANWSTTLANMQAAVSSDFHNLGGTDNVNDADSSVTNEIQNITASQGLARDGSNNFGIMDCAANEIVKRNAGDTAWACAADGGGVTAHSALSGLDNDDHAQYLRADGARAMSGALQMSAIGEDNITAINALVGHNDLYVKGSSAEDKPIYYGASEHKFYTGKTERARIDSSGNLMVWGNISSSGPLGAGSINSSGNISAAGAIGATGNINTSDNIKTGGTARIDSAGNLTNIGTITASGKLDSGSINSSGYLTAETYVYAVKTLNTAGNIQTGGTTRIDSAGNLTNIGTINTSGNIYTNNIYSSGNLRVSGNISGLEFDSFGNSITVTRIDSAGTVFMGYKKEIKDCGAASSCQVDCETGKVVLGGGCSSYNNDSYLYQNRPTDTNTGWLCTHSGGGAKALKAYVICARIAN